MDQNSPAAILSIYRAHAEKLESEQLFPQAAFSKDHSRFFGAEDDHRMPYKRDVDRILHSKAYARYIDKTQVVYLIDNDHVTHRGLHVQLVSSFARGIAEILQLNLALVEAIALGHDVGHAPFGHEGEGYLSALSLEYQGLPFSHPLQSCRLFSLIEPLNLGLAVYDGFLCHDGGMAAPKLTPDDGKNWQTHSLEKGRKAKDPATPLMPATLEGCLVKLCDTISYLGRDIEDAIELKIIQREQVPKTSLGQTNREILAVLAADIIRHSYEKKAIMLSQESFDALKILRRFNFDHIYHHPKLKVESNKVKSGYRYLFEGLLTDLKKDFHASYLWSHFLKNKPASYREQTSLVQFVVDYIAGMTDSFFIRTLEEMMIPKKIKW